MIENNEFGSGSVHKFVSRLVFRDHHYDNGKNRQRRRSDKEIKRLWDKAGRLYPGLHPDDYASPDGGWPAHLRALAAEVVNRHAMGRVTDDELYWAAALEEYIAFVTGDNKGRS